MTQITKVYDDALCKDMLESIVKDSIKGTDGFSLIDPNFKKKDFSQWFGVNWAGESLEGKTITVFCDQGMGDLLNMLRYVKCLKDKGCTIYLNCYSFFDEFKDFIAQLDFVDYFVKDYVKTDFHTNIFSIGSILNGFDYDVHYPAHFRDLLKTNIPEMILEIDIPSKNVGASIGIAWKSNSKNPLAEAKSIDLEHFRAFEKPLCSLLPEKVESDFLIQPDINNVMDTVALIKGLDLVVSVDTMVLHLSGLLGKKTIGLLPKNPDPRWADNKWYKSVTLYYWEDFFKKVNEYV